MGVFKNEVGRPSNKTLRTRRILIGGSILAIVFAIVLIINSGVLSNTGKLKGTVVDYKDYGIKYYVDGGSKHGIVIWHKYYRPNTKRPYTRATIFIAHGSGLNITLESPKSVYGKPSSTADSVIKFDFIVYNRNGLVIEKRKNVKVSKATQSFWFDLPASANRIEIYTKEYNQKTNKLLRVGDKVNLEVAWWPVATINGEENHVKEGTMNSSYTINGVIQNPSKITLYARWITYKNLNQTSSSFKNATKCVEFKSSSYKMDDTIDLYFDHDPNRLAVLKVYSTYDDCYLDNYGLEENDLAVATAKYVLKTNTTKPPATKASASSKIKVGSMFKYNGQDCFNISSEKNNWKMSIYYRSTSSGSWGKPLKNWTDLKAQKYRICLLSYTGKKGYYRVLVRQKSGSANSWRPDSSWKDAPKKDYVYKDFYFKPVKTTTKKGAKTTTNKTVKTSVKPQVK